MSLRSDGCCETANLVLLVDGFFWFADPHHRHTLARRSGRAGFVLGLGAF